MTAPVEAETSTCAECRGSIYRGPDGRRWIHFRRDYYRHDARPEDRLGLMTAAEHRAVRLAGELASLISTVIITPGPSADGDRREVALHAHAIQNMVLAQAAARAYPNRYRLMGGAL